MAIKNSQHLTQTIVDTQGSSLVEPNTFGGRVRLRWFEFNTTDEGAVGGALAAGDEVNLVNILSSKSRIIQGRAHHDDLGTDVSLQFGIKGLDGTGFFDKGVNADDPDFFKLTTSASAIGTIAFADSLAENVGFVTEKAVVITMTIIDAGSISITLDTNVNGYVLYADD